MEAVIDQVRDLAGSADKAGRSKILDQLRELAYSLESSDETINRVVFLVGFLYHIHPHIGAFVLIKVLIFDS